MFGLSICGLYVVLVLVIVVKLIAIVVKIWVMVGLFGLLLLDLVLDALVEECGLLDFVDFILGGLHNEIYHRV